MTLSDDYAWLRAENWQEVMRDPSTLDAEIRKYLEAENAFCEQQLADTRNLQDTLFSEMKGRLKEDDSTVPAPDGPFAYYSNFVFGGQYPLIGRTPREGGPQSVLLDGNSEAKDKPYWDLGSAEHSPDHKLLAYASDEKGSCPTSFPIPMADRFGPTTARRSSTCASMTIIARSRSTGTS